MMNLYSLYDTATAQFTNIFEQPTDAAAIRMVRMLIKKGHIDCPEDFKLYKLGLFDKVEGIVDMHSELTFDFSQKAE